MLLKTFCFAFTIFICTFIQAQQELPLDTALKMQKQIQTTIKKSIPAYVSIGGGSGVLISHDGLILTNDHVISDLKHWEVRTGNGRIYQAQVVGRDSVGDLCLLKITNARTKLPWLPLANSDELEVGQWVLALGNPFLYSTNGSPAASLRIISALHCYQANYGDAIQTDAALNPGNSGGPLIDLQGKIVGISGRIASRFRNRRNSGIGYAISSNQVKNFLPLLKKNEKIQHGEIRGIDFDEEYQGMGASVSYVDTSVSEELKIRSGDILTKVESQPVYNIPSLMGKIWTYPAYSMIKCEFKRGNKVFVCSIALWPRTQE